MKKFLILSAVVALAILALGSVVYANPSFWASSASSSTATTTLAYLRPGLATSSTPVYDAWGINGTNQTNDGVTATPKTAFVKLLVNASSTLTKFNVTLEYSNDSNCGSNPNACEWYQDGIFATTTYPVSLNTPNSFDWTFSSSTVGATGAGALGVNGTNNRATRLFEIPVPLRFVRAITTVSGANGAVYVEIVPVKEVR